ncbi:MAG: hypothetical protein EOP83_37140 [Verrucomicrobiaceae bacterium]|nr:MAG: hypothetical protein EOP83_37140 [Verrucomicrobiaceae bacterium]
MALVKYRECGTDVATSAEACPKCDAPVRRQRLTTRNILLAFCALGMCYVGSCVVLNLSDTSARRPKPPMVMGKPKQVDIGPLLREYGASEVRADATYRGHLIQTIGYVEYIGRDMLDSIYLILTSARGSKLTKLHCTFGEALLQRVANLSRGAHITVRW